MSPRKALRLLVCVLSFSLATACSDACINLANQICDCQPDTTSETNCQQLAQAAESIFPVRGQDETYCQHQLDIGACDCNKLSTPEGRQGCGLSFASPDAGTADAGSP
ncbi:MAG TPA: hypothetical protein VH083_14865 [Myxococcales bacterium]|jgi:hypothetical protein|nr:hypothetical protein [Myxococcales bacterium]